MSNKIDHILDYIEEMTEDDEKHYHGYINETKYFFTFMKLFHRILSSGTLNLPPGLNLTTEFTPCDV